jgi:hypothetical protein
MIEDVDCVRFYQEIRRGIGADALRLGVGRNLYPPSPAVQRHLEVLVRGLALSHRLSQYDSDADSRERALLAGLLDRYLGGVGLTAGDLFFTNGAQEAISTVCGFAADRGLAALLPLPLYYAFEQSSRRWGMPVAGHYRHDGAILWHQDPPSRLLQVAVLPNGITGSLFPLPPMAGPPLGPDAELTLIDCVFQLGAFGSSGSLVERTRQIVRTRDLERSALIFTVSKDLSLPALRAGVLITRNRELLRYARAERFERLYAINPLVGQVVALYFALLLLALPRSSAPSGPDWRELNANFCEAGLEFPGEAEAAAALAHFEAMTERCRRNVGLVRGGGYPLLLDIASTPIAGYSAFPRIASGFAGSDEFVAWIKHSGIHHGLKVNPNYLYGATPAVWDELYPGEFRIRVNVSDEPDELERTLARLATALDRPGLAAGQRAGRPARPGW